MTARFPSVLAICRVIVARPRWSATRTDGRPERACQSALGEVRTGLDARQCPHQFEGTGELVVLATAALARGEVRLQPLAFGLGRIVVPVGPEQLPRLSASHGS